ncbi:NAD(P)/FAD-dependent oxidoreductase [Methylobacterium sp. SyP6R]|uniref:NAD(P)/FAD-dependent oxidoreductase n=1 Tax=Methylobacterium sp. SyP6R TaxID=2718876 RepID=UPI001F40F59B|nr:NAD(P)/FAD-dependent oxidoreductase [Methylobacterium sp. SyP6R]MCF4129934.1 NAD(P)/FAD-dependent oxidoreductase [Methylobacterium sp. SyP6R]
MAALVTGGGVALDEGALDEGEWDAIVVGAGPAGSTAAHGLARGGWRVLLLDRPASGPTIGEALPAAAGRLLAACGLPLPNPAGGHRPLAGTLSAWGSDALEATDFLRDPDGPGWLLDRARFDADLRAAAREAGAVLHPARLRAVERRDGVWRVSTDDGAVLGAAWLVDATGRSAALARRLGARRRRDDAQIAVFGIGAGEGATHLARTLVEARPEGWWYAARLPAGGLLASCQVEAADARRMLRSPRLWREALAATRHLGPALAEVAFPDRLRAVEAGSAWSSRLCGERWIACGDAALAFDPISGQGLFSALHGGMLAARALLAPGAGDAATLRAYVDRHATIRAAYRQRLGLAHDAERRWPDAPYWARRTGREERAA